MDGGPRSIPGAIIRKPTSDRGRQQVKVVPGGGRLNLGLVRSRLAAGGRSHERTRLWTPKFPLAGKIQGISSIPGSAAPQRQRKREPHQFLTGQFPTHPNREFFAALQGIQIGDQRNFRPHQGIQLSSGILGVLPLPTNPIDPTDLELEAGFVPVKPPRARPQIARRAGRRKRSAFRAFVSRSQVRRAHHRRGTEGSNPLSSTGGRQTRQRRPCPLPGTLTGSDTLLIAGMTTRI
jgi:hypothetical protein